MKPRTVADDERREVARRLRELEVCEFDGEFIDRGEVENVLGLVSDDAAVELTRTLECAYAMLSEFIKSVTIEEVN